MRRHDAAQIRAGIKLARQVVHRERARPRNMTPIGHGLTPQLWERAYNREILKHIRPPTGPSRVSSR